MSKSLKNVFDPKWVKKHFSDEKIKVTLKKTFKGYCLYAKKNIKKGNVIAYYKFLVHRNTDNFKGYKNNMYTMSVYNKNGNYNDNLIGDIYEGSLEKPKRGITFWAYFSNEPSGDQSENCYLDVNTKSNYRKRDRVKVGDTLIYRLKASRDIKAGEEITWCYGENYIRNYSSNCE